MPKSKSKLIDMAKRGGVAGGKRPRLRADKPRRADGGNIQAEPLPPPSGDIPGTDIPDRSRSEGANADNDLLETDRTMPNAFDNSPDKDIDRGGWPRQDPFNHPGIVNVPSRGGHKPRTPGPYRR